MSRRRFFVGDPGHGGASDLGDIEWFRTDATPMTESDWQSGYARTLTVFLNGDAIPEPDNLGRRITDDHFLLLSNAHTQPVTFTLPPQKYGLEWKLELDTSTGAKTRTDPWQAAATHSVQGHTVIVLSTSSVPEEEKVSVQAA